MYKRPEFQLADKWSLQTDTAAYFLTLNTSGQNLRLTSGNNNVAANTLSPDRYFMHTFSRNFKDQINAGYAAIVGLYVYSSSYDNGEGWSSRNIQPTSPLIEQYTNLYPSAEGPDPTFRITGFGNALNTRSLQVRVNGTDVLNEKMDYFSSLIKEQMFPRSRLTGVVDTIRIINTSAVNTDRITLGKYEITYPRQFNFGGNTLFEFRLQENLSGNYLEINNFLTNGVAPVLYDLTNRVRYAGDINVSGKVRFALPPGGVRDFVLMNASTTSVQNVAVLTQRKFIDYKSNGLQGDYLMIVHSSLGKSSNGDAIDNYKKYRSSSEGGAHQVGVYDIDELVDQFAYGIKKHPLSVKNFIGYARSNFSISPKNILLVGKGITYDQYRYNESRPITERMNLIPTFGNPGSDNILASIDNDPTPEIPIGRLSVVNGDEINAYLDKVKEHDKSLLTVTQTIASKAWMKNIAHVIGGGDPYLQSVILGYMNGVKNYVQDTSYGARVYTFEKVTSAGVDLVNSGLLGALFAEGLGVITYFGHSSANSMEFNLDNPNVFDNPGKYPLFIANGCNAGNYFINDTLRVTNAKRSITENYVLTPNRGSIGFLASTHYGIVNYLNIYTASLYQLMAGKDYASTIGQIQTNAIADIVKQVGLDDFYNLMTAETILLNGDPAVHLYPQPQADYVVEEPQIKISPNILSVTNANFDLKVKYFNIGKATRDSVDLLVKRELPDGKIVELYRQKRKAVFFSDSIQITVPINPYTDKGQNKIIVELDSANFLSEITHANNSASKIFSIADDEVRPVYPIEFAIVNSSSIKLTASTNSFLQKPAQFLLEVDTTENFNSPLKVTMSQSSLGGVIEFMPSLALKDSLVFYWRVAKKPDTGNVYRWSNSSFVYLSKSSPGWNQSHYFQYLKDVGKGLNLSLGEGFYFDSTINNLNLISGIYGYSSNTVYNGLSVLSGPVCIQALNSIEVMVINLKTGNTMTSNPNSGSGGFNFNKYPSCLSESNRFYFNYNNSQSRNNARLLFDLIPPSSLIVIMNWTSIATSPNYIDTWKSDTSLFGSGNSLYHKFKSIGLSKIDSFYRKIPFIFVAKKDNIGKWDVLLQSVGQQSNSVLTESLSFTSYKKSGNWASSIIGPAKSWATVHWSGNSSEQNSADEIKYKIYGLNKNFSDALLYSSNNKIKDTSISFIDAKTYPYLRVEQENSDTVNHTPWQQRYFQVKYDPVPEGALMTVPTGIIKDTLEVGEPMNLQLAFKNISASNFDSLRLFATATDPKNNTTILFDGLRKPLISNDTIQVNYTLDTKNLSGDNSIFINVNPNYAQPEQYLFNNYLNKNIYVRPDNYAPNLDVTFDGIHILNKDIVSPRPNIVIKLKDDSRYLALNDTSLFSVRLRYPDGTLRTIKFDNDTLQFSPSANPLGGNNNTASLLFKPYLTEDGEYELMVTAKDRSNNLSGSMDYSVIFQVINKSMITNLLNYPNPFTTTTAFVFTLTGAQLPTQFRIQILTVTGKIVKEISKQELGPLKVGTNITEYKWDGRDQFGQPLANGVYLYRVLTDINGKKLEKLKSGNFNTEKYFQSGYGKMYLMR
jgi:hypothetical protein